MPESEDAGSAIQVTAALLRKDGRWLITRRPTGSHLAGLWEFPGGKQKEGESLEECLAREIEEETGLRVAVGEKQRAVTHHYAERTVHLHFFDCQPIEGEARPIGCADVAWITPEEFAEYDFPPADEPVVSDIVEGRL